MMSKRTNFTTVTALPAGISRQTVLETLHDHFAMIDLNPLVTERHPIKPPPEATPEEFNCKWYSVTDKVNYLPGGLYSGSVTFNGCFHDLPDGLQTHIYAPMGLNMKGRWTLGGSLPGEPIAPVEIGLGVPKTGLWLREDVDMKCNFAMTKFVKGTTKKAHTTLVSRLVEKAHLIEAQLHNSDLAQQLNLRDQYPPDYHSQVASPCGSAPAPYPVDKPIQSTPTSPPLGGPYTGHPALSSQGSRYSGGNQSYYNAGYQDYRTSAYVAPLNPKARNSYITPAPGYHNPPQFAAELPSYPKPPMELDSTQRY
ncbi:hypothetical protein ABVK25_012180 [Lepraria finkii]|uniref:DUF7053 domain-containing protein n=1 Tax=Lepraria finkii TaxID=1340010 RepID=A0ABR4AL05_9LECA